MASGFDLQEAGVKEINKKLTKNWLVKQVNHTFNHLWQKAVWQLYDEFIKDTTKDMFVATKNAMAREQYNMEVRRMIFNEGYIPEGAYTDSKFITTCLKDYWKKYLQPKLTGKTREEQHEILMDHAKQSQLRMYERSPNTHVLNPELNADNSLITPERLDHAMGAFMLHPVRSEYLRLLGNDATRMGMHWDTHMKRIGLDLLQYSQEQGLGKTACDDRGNPLIDPATGRALKTEGFYVGMGKPHERMDVDDTFRAILDGAIVKKGPGGEDVRTPLHDPNRYNADAYKKKLEGILKRIDKAEGAELRDAVVELRDFMRKDTADLFLRVLSFDQLPKDGSELIKVGDVDAKGKPLDITADGRSLVGTIHPDIKKTYGVKGYGTKSEWQPMIAGFAKDMRIDGHEMRNLQSVLDAVESFRVDFPYDKPVGRHVVPVFEDVGRMNKFDEIINIYGQPKGSYVKADVAIGLRDNTQNYGLSAHPRSRDGAQTKGKAAAREYDATTGTYGALKTEDVLDADGKVVMTRVVMEKETVGQGIKKNPTAERFAEIKVKDVEGLGIPEGRASIIAGGGKIAYNTFRKTGIVGSAQFYAPSKMESALSVEAPGRKKKR